VVGDSWRRRRGRGGGVDGSFTVELLHRLRKREKEENKSLRFEGLMSFYYYSDSLLLTINY